MVVSLHGVVFKPCNPSLAIPFPRTVPVGGEVRCEFTVKPSTKGERTLCVMFDSKELEDVDGMLTVTVATQGESSSAAPRIAARLQGPLRAALGT